MINRISSLNFNPVRRSPSFGSNSGGYRAENGNPIQTYTNLFRPDMEWKEFTDFIVDHFRDKDNVNIVQFAASDGSEAYTQIISLKEWHPSVKKFFPIEAYDINPEICKAAQSGLINITNADFNKFKHKLINPEKYFKKSNQELVIPGDTASGAAPISVCSNNGYQIIDYKSYKQNDYIKNINKKLSVSTEQVQYSSYNGKIITSYVFDVLNDQTSRDAGYLQTYEVSDELKSNVNFHNADMFDVLFDHEDNSDSVILCRNILDYLSDREVDRFTTLAASVLKKGSVFVIGEIDYNRPTIANFLQQKGFRFVMPNVYVKV